MSVSSRDQRCRLPSHCFLSPWWPRIWVFSRVAADFDVKYRFIPPGGTLLDGFQGRLFEFCNFERKFEVSSKRLVVHKTKKQIYQLHHHSPFCYIQTKVYVLWLLIQGGTKKPVLFVRVQYLHVQPCVSILVSVQECISQSAVQTKFAQHTANGKLITSELRTIMEDIFENSTKAKYVFVEDSFVSVYKHHLISPWRWP